MNKKQLIAFVVGLYLCCVVDVFAGTWLVTGPLNTARVDHTTTLLSNGKVLVAGGRNAYNGGCIATAELYDPSTGNWTATGSLNNK
jgi:hypothetical protein